ncbi:hypothetical protein [Aeromonas phage AS-zj]|uniref:Uncharacterized protein n=1 Tax=Aeromonas phage AS-zj TaxID=2024208 RepID=A0A223LFL1_9CAUD|nr:hypothetical protein HWB28_gp273 [Aeromonas phage AS-zj]ASU00279.1 hypothetical protein [Aeromonas phage AS-zj]
MKIVSVDFVNIIKKELVDKNLLRYGVDVGVITDVKVTIGGSYRIFVGRKSYVYRHCDEMAIAF